MKFSLVFLLLCFFTINACFAAPSENNNGFGGALQEFGEDILENCQNNKEDSGSDEEDAGEAGDDEDDDEDNDEKDEDDEEEESTGDAERKRREIGKIATRYVRDAVMYHTNIISDLYQAINGFSRR